MARSAAEKLQDFMNECHGTRAVIKEFTDVSRAKYGDFGYAAGYLESLMVDILMELPKKRREEFRAQLSNKAYKISVEA
jgi:uncharacterized iron-regulated protein